MIDSQKSIRCPLCGNVEQSFDNTVKTPTYNARKKAFSFLSYAILAPWINEKINPNQTKITMLIKCLTCNLKFYTYRYSQSDNERIYSGYRDNSYFILRNRWEPWYTRTLNEAYTKEKNIAQRREQLSRLIQPMEQEIDELQVCLDFGGDQGQYFPDFAKKKIIVELQNKKENETDEIVRVNEKNLHSLEKQIDLVMFCMTLEHISNIQETANKLSTLLRKRGILVVEIPMDDFKTSKLHRYKIYKYYLLTLSKFRISFIAMDFIGGVFRNIFGIIPFFGIVKQSEHIQYFNEAILTRVFHHLKLENIVVDQKRRIEHLRIGYLGAVFRRE